MDVCVRVCACVTILWSQSSGSEQLAGPHLNTYWPALRSPVIQANLMFLLGSAAAELQLTPVCERRARESGALRQSGLSNIAKISVVLVLCN